PLNELSLLTSDEWRRQIVDWNDTAADYPRELCLHELVERQADRTPERVAVVSDGRQLTYAELDARANQLAHLLLSRGVGPGRRVGVCLERSVEMVVGLLAVLKSGGAYLPLDPTYPARRIRFMVEDAEPVVVLSERAVAAKVLRGITGVVQL